MTLEMFSTNSLVHAQKKSAVAAIRSRVLGRARSWRKPSSIATLATVLATFVVGMASAWATVTDNWTGVMSTDFADTANWSNGVPDGTVATVIDLASGNVSIISSGTFTLSGLTVGQSNASASNQLTVGGASSLIDTANVFIGSGSAASGAVIVTALSSWEVDGEFSVGGSGVGNLTVSNGGLVTAAGADVNGFALSIGTNATGNGNVTVTGVETGSNTTSQIIANGGAIVVGNQGTGVLTIANGGNVSVTSSDNAGNGIIVGNGGSAVGAVSVDGFYNTTLRSTLTGSNGPMIVGLDGTGNVSVTNAGQIISQGTDGSHVSGYLGYDVGSTGNATISGGNSVAERQSTWSLTRGLVIGYQGNGTVEVTNGGLLQTATVGGDSNGYGLVLGAVEGANGNLTVTGYTDLLAVSQVAVDHGALVVGSAGNGNLSVSNSGYVSAGGADAGNVGVYIGVGANATGYVTLNGADSVMDVSGGALIVGEYGFGQLSIQNNAQVEISGNNGANISVIIGNNTGANGQILVDDAHGEFDASGGAVIIGNAGSGNFTVDAGALAQTQTPDGSNYTVYIAYSADGTGSALVTDTGSTWQADGGTFAVGYAGNGSLTVQNGGSLTTSGMVVGDQADSVGSVTVTDTNSIISSSDGQLIVANNGNGSLTIQNGGNVTFAGDDIEGISAIIGQGVSSVGNITVTGENSTLNLTGELLIGNYGSGNLSLADCGIVQASTVMLAFTNGGSGSLFIDGANTNMYAGSIYVAGDTNTTASISITNGGYLEAANIDVGSFGNGTVTVTDSGSFANITGGGSYVGNNEGGNGTLTVSNGGAFFSNGSLAVGYEEGSTGNVTVTDAGSNLTVAGSLNVADTGNGTLSIYNGGIVNADSMEIGVSGGGNGFVTVSDVNSTLAITDGDLIVGDFGNGTLTVQNGGNVSVAGTFYIGYDVGTGNATVTDANSTLSASSIYVGDDSEAFLTIANGGNVSTSGSVYVGDDSNGTITVTGANSTLGVEGTLYVGYSDFYVTTLAVNNGGQVIASYVTVGSGEETNGTLTVADAGSNVSIDTNLIVGDEGSGNLTVSNGGNVTTSYLGIGYNNGGNGTVTVADTNSTLYANSVDVSDDGNGTLNIQNGGLVSIAGNVYVGDGGDGFVTVSDVNSTLSVGDTLHVGYENDFSGNGNLTVTNGGTVTAGALVVGTYEDTNGTVTVSETNSTLHITNTSVVVGNEGSGTIYLYNGGALTIDSTNGYNNVLVLGNQTDSSGNLFIGRLSSFGTGIGNVVVGLHGYGNLTYEQGATGTFTDNVTLFAGKRSDSEGDINVDGEGSTLTLNGSNLVLGQKGSGYLSISNGGAVDATLVASSIMLGVNCSGYGEIDLYDGGTLTLGAFDGYVINVGNGSGNIYFAGGTLQATGNTSIYTSSIFVNESSSTITVGDNATLTLTGNSDGDGALNVNGNGTLVFANFSGNVGDLTIGNATVVVDGADDAILHSNGTATLGNAEGDIATLHVTNGANLSIGNNADESASLVVGANANTTASVLVDGEGALYVFDNTTIVGNEGAGSLTVTNSGSVQLDGYNEEGNSLVISGTETGNGSVTVSNSGNLYLNGGLVVGAGNTGSLTVANGGVVEINGDDDTDTGLRVSNNSTVAVSDDNANGTSVTVDSGVADIANGSLSISGGNFTVSSDSLVIGADNSTASVTQTGGNVTVSDENSYLIVGYGENSTASYDISGGNLLVNGGLIVANHGGANGTFTVSDGSVTVENGVRIGSEGDGTLNISGGTFDTTDNNLLLSSNDTNGNATVNLTGGVLATTGIHRDSSEGTVLLNLNGGTLRANDDNSDFLANFADDEITIGENGVTFDSNCFDIGVYSNLTGNGALTKIGHGKLTLYGFTSVTDATVNGGKLIINDSEMDVSGDLDVASQWCVTASLKIVCSALVDTTNLIVAGGRHSTGTVTVSNSELNAIFASIGKKGDGTLTINNGGSAYIGESRPALDEGDGNISMVIGAMSCSTGTVNVDGEESSLYITSGALIVGDCGTGYLTVSNGGYMLSSGSDSNGIAAYIGGYNGHSGSGTVTVTDEGSQWRISGGALVVDAGGTGTLNIENGGLVKITGTDESGVGLYMGQNLRDSSSISISGEGSELRVCSGSALIGLSGEASLSVYSLGFANFSGSDENGNGLVLDGSAYVSDHGNLTVSSGGTIIGSNGSGSLEVTNAGYVNVYGTNNYDNALVLGRGEGSQGNITVHNVSSDNGRSELDVENGPMIIGLYGNGSLDIENGGAVNLYGTNEAGVGLTLGYKSDSNGTLVISDVESSTGDVSQLNVSGALVVGRSGTADMRIYNGGQVIVGADTDNSINLVVGDRHNGNGSITVSGVNTFGVDGNTSSAIYVDSGAAIFGNHGDAFVAVYNGGLIDIEGADDNGVGLYLGYNSCSYGDLQLTGVELCTNITSTLELDSGILVVGYSGQGNLAVANGAHLVLNTTDANGVEAYLGYNNGSSGYLTITGVETSSNTSTSFTFDQGSLIVGNHGSGTLIVSNGGNVSISGSDSNGNGLYAGFFSDATGSVNVHDIESSSGIRSTLTVTGSPAMLGYDGYGSLSIGNGGLVNLFGVDGSQVGAYLGLDEGSTGGISVFDVNRNDDPVASTLIVNRALVVGASGNGSMSVSNGGYVSIAGVGADNNGVGLYIAQGNTSSSSVDVRDVERHSGTRSTLEVANGSIIVANQGNGGLSIYNGGLVQVLGHDEEGIGLMIGLDANGTGSLYVADVANICSNYTASTLNFNGSALVVGGNGYGCVSITNGGYVTGGTDGLGVILGNNEGAAGYATISGVESNSGYQSELLVNAGALVVGNEGNGTLTIENGGVVSASGNTNDGGNVGLLVGNGANSTAYVYVRGVETTSGNYSTLNVDKVALVGFDGNGTVTISNGGFFDVNGYNCGGIGLGIGYNETGTGTVTVTGEEFCSSRLSELDVYNGALVVGYSGNGTLQLLNGGSAYLYPDAVDTNGYSLAIGYNEGSTGSVVVDGAAGDTPSRLQVDSGVVAAGIDGTGNIAVTNGGKLVLLNGEGSGLALDLGVNETGNGSLTVDGDGSSVAANAGYLMVGDSGQGALTITNNGTAEFDGRDENLVGLYVGANENSTGNVTISNNGSLIINGAAVFGDYGNATVNITNGGNVSINGRDDDHGFAAYIGWHGTSNSTVTVDGNGSSLYLNGTLVVGNWGTGALDITNAGYVQINGSDDNGVGLYVGRGRHGYGDVLVSDTGVEFVEIDEEIVPITIHSSLDVESGAVVVGGDGHGNLTIANGAQAFLNGQDNQEVALYVGLYGHGNVTVTDEDSALNVSGGALIVDQGGHGYLTVANGGTVNVDYAVCTTGLAMVIGYGALDHGVVTVDGEGSTLNVTNGSLAVGFSGRANLTASNGGSIILSGNSSYDGSAMTIGTYNSCNQVLITDLDSSLSITNGALLIGLNATGNLTVVNGASANISGNDGSGRSLILGVNSEGTGELYIDSSLSDEPVIRPLHFFASSVDVSNGAAYVGLNGSGYVTVTNGGRLTINGTDDNSVALDLGRNADSFGSVLVTGDSSELDVLSGAVRVGDYGTGNLTVANGAFVDLEGSDDRGVGLFIGRHESGNGTVLVTDANTELEVDSGAVRVGDYGTGNLTAANGATVVLNSQDDNGIALYVGHHETGNGTVLVDGEGSQLSISNSDDNGGAVVVGDAGTGNLTISNGGNVSIDGYDNDETSLFIARNGGNGTVLVTDAGSSLNLINEGYAAIVGASGNGFLNVVNGGSFYSNGWDDDGVALYVGKGSDSYGRVIVDNAGSSFTVDEGSVIVGDQGAGYFLITNGASVGIAPASGNEAGALIIARNSTSETNEVYVAGENSTLTVGVAPITETITPAISGGNLIVVGDSGNATLDIEEGGLVTAHGGILLANQEGSNGNVIVVENATLEVGGENGLAAGDGNYTFNLDGGRIRVIDSDLTTSLNIFVGDLGCYDLPNIIDTNGFNATFSGVLSGGGFFQKEGDGNLTLAANETLTGGINVLRGSLIVDGALGGNIGSWCVSAGDLYVGMETPNTTAALYIVNGARVFVDEAEFGNHCFDYDVILVSDSCSKLVVNEYLTVGEVGYANLTIANGGTVKVLGSSDNGSSISIGRESNGSGLLVVDGESSQLIAENGTVRVGDYGAGELVVTNGASVSFNGTDSRNVTLYVGRHDESNGTVTVDNGTLSINNGGVRVGDYGTGALSVTNGGEVDVNGVENSQGIALDIGRHEGSNGTVTVDGSGSAIYIANGATVVGNSGNGTLNIVNGSSLTSGGFGDGIATAVIGHNEGSNGTVNVTGAPIEPGIVTPSFQPRGWAITNGALVVGDSGNGTLNVSNGGKVDISSNGSGASLYVGINDGASGVITVDGESSSLSIGSGGGAVYVGYNGNSTGSVSVTNGGTFTITPNVNLVLGLSANSTGTVEVAGGSLNVTVGAISVGDHGNGVLNITNGGYANTNYMSVGTWPDANGSVLVDGEGSSLVVGSSDLGYHGNGSLTVSNGGDATFSSYLSLGTASDGGNGTLLVNDGTVTVGGIAIGTSGDGRANVVNNGVLTSNGNVTVGGTSSFGSLTLANGGELQVGGTNGITGAGNYTISMDGGIIQVINDDLTTSVNITLGSCFELPNIIDTNCFDATFSGILSGSGSLEKDGHGTLYLTNNNVYSGDTIVHQGTLVVDFAALGGDEVGDLIVGDVCFSHGTFIAQNVSTINVDNVVIGRDSHSHGHATVDDSSLYASGIVTIGDYGHGSLSVVNDGYVGISGANDDGFGLILGANSCFATGNLTVDNSGLEVLNGSMLVGATGSGCVTLTNGGTISVNGTLLVGYDGNSTGSVTINGGGSFEVLGAGDNGAGLTIGRYEGSNGSVSVSDEESNLKVENGSVRVGDYGQGSLGIFNGANITLNGTQDNGSTLVVGRHESGNGTVLVSGMNSTLNIDNGSVRVGDYGTGALYIDNGGVVNTNGADEENGIGLYVGKHSGSNGTLQISGNQSALYMYNGFLAIGYDGSGNVTISDGGFLGTGAATEGGIVAAVGAEEDGNGTVTVTGVSADSGNQSTFVVVQGSLAVGLNGSGMVNVANGGLLEVTDSDESGTGLYIGYAEGSNGTVTVDGVAVTGDEESPVYTPSALSLDSSSLVVGSSGNGSLTVSNGGNASVGFSTHPFLPEGFNAILGDNEGSNGTVLVTDAGSLFLVSGNLIVGESGNGSLTVANGGNTSIGFGAGPLLPAASDLIVGANEGSNGTVTVTDANSTLIASGNLIVGGSGNGSLTVANGGSVTADIGTHPTTILDPTSIIGQEEGSNGTVTVTGANSTLDVEAFTSVGGNGTGSLTVADGGNATISAIDVATGANSTGTILVTDANSTLTVNEFLGVGNYGTGTLTVANGGTVNASSIGLANSGNGTIIVEDANSTLITTGIGVGYSGVGNLTVANGGTVYTNGLSIGLTEEGLGGTVTVTDANSTITANGSIIVGENGLGNLTIANGAVFSNEGMDGDENGLIVANATNSTGYMTLTDGGSQYNAYEGAVLIGRSGNGTLAIENGAKMMVSGSDEDAFAMHLGVEEGSSGTVTVSGICSSLQLTDSGLVIGGNGSGNLNILCGGEVDIASGSSLMIAFGANSTGIVNLNHGGTLKIGGEEAIQSGAGAATFNLNGGTIRAKSDFTTSMNFTLGSGTSTINTGSHTGTVSGSINGTGNLSKNGTGTLVLTGNSAYNGTNINNGNLVVDGNLTSNVTIIGSTAALGGNGTVNGNVLQNAGSVSPGVANAVTGNQAAGFANLTINGDLTMNATVATLAWHLGSNSTVSDVLNVLGNLTAGQANPSITFDFQNTGFFDAVTPQTYVLINANNDISAEGFNFSASNLDSSIPAWVVSQSYFLYPNGGKTLEFVLVPEPATWSLILGGAMLLLGLRRKRKV